MGMYRAWTKADIEKCRSLALRGVPIKTICKILRRPMTQVREKVPTPIEMLERPFSQAEKTEQTTRLASLYGNARYTSYTMKSDRS